MNLPSEELLSEVLGDLYRERLVEVIHIEENTLQTFYDCGSGEPTCLGIEINLYELAHKCKEWAVKNYKCSIKSKVEYINEDMHGYSDLYLDNGIRYKTNFHGASEPEAIFKACQWILDNKETK